MFKPNDYEAIDTDYFIVIAKTGNHIILKSKNTKHLWDICSREFIYGHVSLVISHKHHEEQPWHEQACFHPKTVTEAQNMIKRHDEFQLNGRKKKSTK